LIIYRICILAIFLRVVAYIYCIDFLKKRPELNVPHNSFRRLIDGIFMLRDGVSPYDGDVIHCQPILLYLFGALIDYPNLLLIMFLSFDIMTSEILRVIATIHMKNQGSSVEDVERIADLVSKCYMLNPVAVASCAIFSLSVLCNLITSLFILAFVKSSVLFSSILFSVLVHLSLYPAVYICALLVKFSTLKERTLIIIYSVILLVGLLFSNRFLNESNWNYIDSTYKFLLDVRDLTPNVGIFWYFFIEVFNHFRRFFLWVFQINVLVYLVPLSLTLRSNAFLLLHQLMILISVFASYPSMADSLIYLSLLPLFEHLKKYFRWGLITGGALSATMVLAPVMWQMWIVTGSGNANFYFAATLTYSIAQIFLLTDLLYGYLRLKLVEGRGITSESEIAILMFK
uniref:Phosphatidylinositol glycan anchor biosynthesis class U protein n=1 Tax=Elaeophora elaphi TaxID=1147741 RepID=A0A0R3RU97_9BILA